MMIEMPVFTEKTFISAGGDQRLVADVTDGENFRSFSEGLLYPDPEIRSVRSGTEAEYVSAKIDERVPDAFFFR